MPYSEYLADRVRQALKNIHIGFEEKRMMGGLTFMVNNKMCVGIVSEELMARIGKENYEAALQKPGVRKMDFTGKPMKGYVFIEAAAIDEDNQLNYWTRMAVEFNRTLA